ncbi:hypothetical protein ASPZODRAFT_57987 [Penicilliopsis zonata CBS 506.65]|uniref:Zn(2)-C6 fungal-type domain-containing protein n=1 Tax=Penicilliopsis zonata CBS 506.65 TaxID=1073090 RepID=A0A1L9SSW2_9EURO|nr:hypothetical protein ASPZODRAFT_57987 [Penicilliopsis zonata CBS 506.65]OJJ50300.1 hypothetical protein ASPZODRAFT_57987 [Penicilliopsis zonata CBS 506.65]
MTTRNNNKRPSAPLACTECRKQHLKCDAARPACSRCRKTALPCHYLPSRRGGCRRRQSQPAASISGVGASVSSRVPSGTSSSLVYDTPLAIPGQFGASGTLPPTPVTTTTASTGVWPGVVGDDAGHNSHNDNSRRGHDDAEDRIDDRLVRLFYENFHGAHPILVPSSLFAGRRYPHFLHLVVAFIGSHYAPPGPSQQLLGERVATELAASPDRSPAMVQAQLMYAIALYARGHSGDAQAALGRSVAIALELGMYRRDFAPGRDIEAESMRRTWWELYIADVLMAVLHEKSIFQCSSVPYDVALPCEEAVYAGAGSSSSSSSSSSNHIIPEPPTLLDFKQRVFAADELAFSSFSYRIDATRILSRVLALNRLQECHRDHLQAVENALVSWINHIPAKKVDIVDAYGNVDEMIFQAHLTVNYAAMLLHLPRSHLQPVLPEAAAVTTAAAGTASLFAPWMPAHRPPSFTRLVHSIKATEASKQLSDFVSVCPSVHRHSPFLVSALVLCSVVQLATSLSHGDDCFDHHCNRVILVLGCLKNLRRTWAVADPAYHHVRTAAASILANPMRKLSPDQLPSSTTTTTTTTTTTPAAADSSSTASATATADHDLASCHELTPAFIDPTCSSTYFFNTIPDFDLT